MTGALQERHNMLDNEEIDNEVIEKQQKQSKVQLENWSDDDDCDENMETEEEEVVAPKPKPDLYKFEYKGATKRASSPVRRPRTQPAAPMDNDEEDAISDSEEEREEPRQARKDRNNSRRNAKTDDTDDVNRPCRANRAVVNYTEKRGSSDDDILADSEEDGEGAVSDSEGEKPLLSEDMSDSSSSSSEDEASEDEDQPRRTTRERRPVTKHNQDDDDDDNNRRQRRQGPARRSNRNEGRTRNYNIDEAYDFDGSDSEEMMENLPPVKKKKKIKAVRQKKKKKVVAAGRRNAILDSDEDESSSSSSSEEDSEFGSDVEMVDVDEEEEEDFAEDELTLENADLSKVECVLAARKCPETNERQLFVKIKGYSYRHAIWAPREPVMALRTGLVRAFERKKPEELDPYGDRVNGIDPEWLKIDRIIAQRPKTDTTTTTATEGDDNDDDDKADRLLLVKWKALGYADSTWESEATLRKEGDADVVDRFDELEEKRQQKLEKKNMNDAAFEQSKTKWRRKAKNGEVPEFKNGRALRDYQLESLKWMVEKRYNAVESINCILGDEMGLGKTAQSIAVLEYQRQLGHGIEAGPFLIVAPLTTLGHWQREIQTWTDMDVVLYAGTAEDRTLLRKYDLWLDHPGRGGRSGLKNAELKPDVVLISYDTLLRDEAILGNLAWDTVIVDEAHRLKSITSATRRVVQNLELEWLLLLTGTPVQNNMRELYGLMNLLDASLYHSETEFLEMYGDERVGMSAQQVQRLQDSLRKVLLRRMKEDVETLPEKEEVIIWVELTKEQRAYYKAIYENQIGTLLSGTATKNLPNLRNLAMELRKVCCHPALCDGLEEDMAARRRAHGEHVTDLQLLTQASGKMLLLHKLLPKLRSEGRKVLIFSQFKIMLNVLEDYCNLSGYPVERIDGSVTGRDRQAAIDRFSKEDSDSFVFLLSTRAGGQGITLTAADTAIIYDSDWNPQNDLQAMARCHRIGQDKDVTIYRLVCRDTYEQHVFRTSSRKYGLDEAILGGIGNTTASGTTGGSSVDNNNNPKDPEMDGKKIAELLKNGAHCLQEIEGGNEATDAFEAEDINQILQGRTEKRQIGSRAGNTFSVATFAVNDGKEDDPNQNVEDYWASLLPEAAAGHEAKKKAGPEELAPRRRKKVNYNEVRRPNDTEYVNGNDAVDSDDDDDISGDGNKVGKSTKAAAGGGNKANNKAKVRQWLIQDVNTLFDCILHLGLNRTQEALTASGLANKHPLEEAIKLETFLVALVKKADDMAPNRPSKADAAAAGATNAVNLNAVMAAAGPGATVNDVSATLAAAEAEKKKEHADAWKKYEAECKKKAGELLVAVVEELPGDVKELVDNLPEPTRNNLQKDSIVRWLKNQNKFSNHLEQRRLLSQLITDWERVETETAINATTTADNNNNSNAASSAAQIKVPYYHNRYANLPPWFKVAENIQLLKGCHAIGFGVPISRSVTATVDVEAIMADARFGFNTRVRKVNTTGGVVNNNGAGGSKIAGATSAVVVVSVGGAGDGDGAKKEGDDDNKPLVPLAPAVGSGTTTLDGSAANGGEGGVKSMEVDGEPPVAERPADSFTVAEDPTAAAGGSVVVIADTTTIGGGASTDNKVFGGGVVEDGHEATSPAPKELAAAITKAAAAVAGATTVAGGSDADKKKEVAAVVAKEGEAVKFKSTLDEKGWKKFIEHVIKHLQGMLGVLMQPNNKANMVPVALLPEPRYVHTIENAHSLGSNASNALPPQHPRQPVVAGQSRLHQQGGSGKLTTAAAAGTAAMTMPSYADLPGSKKKNPAFAALAEKARARLAKKKEENEAAAAAAAGGNAGDDGNNDNKPSSSAQLKRKSTDMSPAAVGAAAKQGDSDPIEILSDSEDDFRPVAAKPRLTLQHTTAGGNGDGNGGGGGGTTTKTPAGATLGKNLLNNKPSTVGKKSPPADDGGDDGSAGGRSGVDVFGEQRGKFTDPLTAARKLNATVEKADNKGKAVAGSGVGGSGGGFKQGTLFQCAGVTRGKKVEEAEVQDQDMDVIDLCDD